VWRRQPSCIDGVSRHRPYPQDTLTDWWAQRLSVAVLTPAVRRAGPVEEIIRFVENQLLIADGRGGAAAGRGGDPARRVEPLDECRLRQSVAISGSGLRSYHLQPQPGYRSGCHYGLIGGPRGGPDGTGVPGVHPNGSRRGGV